jgi:hypothetical protein
MMRWQVSCMGCMNYVMLSLIYSWLEERDSLAKLIVSIGFTLRELRSIGFTLRELRSTCSRGLLAC